MLMTKLCHMCASEATLHSLARPDLWSQTDRGHGLLLESEQDKLAA